MIIDFHTHTFPDKISRNVIEQLSHASKTKAFTDGSLSQLIDSMKQAGVDYSVTLPVMTSVEQVEKINASIILQKEILLEKGIVAFGGIHPDYPEFKKELRRLKYAGVKGIKLHPVYQRVDFDDIRILRILDAASSLGLIILVHAGLDVGIPEECPHIDIPKILRVLHEVHPENLVLAHMGGWQLWNDVAQYLAKAPVYFDTAFSIGHITPRHANVSPLPTDFNLSNEQFISLVRKHGTDKILFATDSPWEAQKDYIERLNRIPLTQDEREAIFCGNAQKLLQW